MSLIEAKLAYCSYIDRHAEDLARHFCDGGLITERVLLFIREIYKSADLQRSEYNKDNLFDSAYHTPITGDLEFFIARILYHVSNIKSLGWKIRLRRAEAKVVPDIRIVKNDNIIAIVEVKAKGGWAQPAFSKDRYENDKKRLEMGLSTYDPDNTIKEARAQVEKYRKHLTIPSTNVFILLPTLVLIHRKKYARMLSDYFDYFHEIFELPMENLILLSQNMCLDLAKAKDNSLQPTRRFEDLLEKLAKIS